MQSEDGAGQRSRGFDYLMGQGCAGFARQWVPGRDCLNNARKKNQ
jgi:hypothetical protein